MAEVQLIDIEKIQQTHETQAREKIDKVHVSDLAEAMKSGSVLDPVDLFVDGQSYWVGDGHHRIEAAIKNNVKQIRARVHSGGKVAAILHAAGANAAHGLKRSNDDKRRAVRMAWGVKPDWSDGQVAEHCGVSQPFVSKMRRENEGATQNGFESNPAGAIKNEDSSVRKGKDGRTINTANIGAKPKPKPAESAPKSDATPSSDDEPDWMKEGEKGEEKVQTAEVAPVDPDSLEAVQGDIDEAVKALRQCAKQWQDTLRIETKDEQTLVTRPWCGRFSAATAKQLRSYASELVTHTPLSGEPDNPYTKADEKNDKVKEKDRK